MFNIIELVVSIYLWITRRRIQARLRRAHPGIPENNWRRVKYLDERRFGGWFPDGAPTGAMAIGNERVLFWVDGQNAEAPTLTFKREDAAVRYGVKGKELWGAGWILINQDGSKHYFQPNAAFASKAKARDLYDRLRAVLPEQAQTQ